MYNWKPLSYESYCDAELGSVPLSKHKDYLYLVVAKRDWTVSNKETTYDPSLKGPTVVPGRDRASCRLTDARKVPNLIKVYFTCVAIVPNRNLIWMMWLDHHIFNDLPTFQVLNQWFDHSLFLYLTCVSTLVENFQSLIDFVFFLFCWNGLVFFFLKFRLKTLILFFDFFFWPRRIGRQWGGGPKIVSF